MVSNLSTMGWMSAEERRGPGGVRVDRTKKEENLRCRATLCQLVWLGLVEVMWMLPARKGNMAEKVTNQVQPRRQHRGVLVPWERRIRIPFHLIPGSLLCGLQAPYAPTRLTREGNNI